MVARDEMGLHSVTSKFTISPSSVHPKLFRIVKLDPEADTAHLVAGGPGYPKVGGTKLVDYYGGHQAQQRT